MPLRSGPRHRYQSIAEISKEKARTPNIIAAKLIFMAQSYFTVMRVSTLRSPVSLLCSKTRCTVHMSQLYLTAMTGPSKIKGRGAGLNPVNRFEKIHFEKDADWNPDDDRSLRTEFFRDTTQTIINYNNSPDVGFETSVNPYRGCEHGCVYCFARPTHEYLGFSSGLDFESRIMVKENAPELLRKELSSRKWKPQVVVMSAVTDC